MGWPDRVVILIDIPDIKDLAREGDSQASRLMRKFHKLVQNQVNRKLKNIEHAYVFNDSALLLSYGDDTTASFRPCLRDADQLKRNIDSLTAKWGCAPAYGIAVKGQAFPSHELPSQEQSSENLERVTVLRTSSYAMANCFLIEAKAKRNNCKKPWYIDERLVEYICSKPCCALPVNMLPEDKERKIYLFDKYLWNEV